MQKMITQKDYESADGDLNKIPVVKKAIDALENEKKQNALATKFFGDSIELKNVRFYYPTLVHRWAVMIVSSDINNTVIYYAFVTYILSQKSETVFNNLQSEMANDTFLSNALKFLQDKNISFEDSIEIYKTVYKPSLDADPSEKKNSITEDWFANIIHGVAIHYHWTENEIPHTPWERLSKYIRQILKQNNVDIEEAPSISEKEIEFQNLLIECEKLRKQCQNLK